MDPPGCYAVLHHAFLVGLPYPPRQKWLSLCQEAWLQCDLPSPGSTSCISSNRIVFLAPLVLCWDPNRRQSGEILWKSSEIRRNHPDVDGNPAKSDGNPRKSPKQYSKSCENLRKFKKSKGKSTKILRYPLKIHENLMKS